MQLMKPLFISWWSGSKEQEMLNFFNQSFFLFNQYASYVPPKDHHFSQWYSLSSGHGSGLRRIFELSWRTSIALTVIPLKYKVNEILSILRKLFLITQLCICKQIDQSFPTLYKQSILVRGLIRPTLSLTPLNSTHPADLLFSFSHIMSLSLTVKCYP